MTVKRFPLESFRIQTYSLKMVVSLYESAAANAAAVTRDYVVDPRLDYRTVIGVKGPLVILDKVKVRFGTIDLMKSFQSLQKSLNSGLAMGQRGLDRS